MQRKELAVGEQYGLMSGTGSSDTVRAIVRVVALDAVRTVRTGDWYSRRDADRKGILYVVEERYDYRGNSEELTAEAQAEEHWVATAKAFVPAETARGRVRGVKAVNAARARDKDRIAKLKEYGVEISADLWRSSLSESSSITMSLAQLRKLLPANAIPDPWND